ncbi:MAG: hypothetical protein ACXVE9_18600, partial [Solirubrobacteraceae bacterium]
IPRAHRIQGPGKGAAQGQGSLDPQVGATRSQVEQRGNPVAQELDLILHTVDSIRVTPRAQGLDNNPRTMQGTIEVPPATLARLDSLPTSARSFINTYLHDARFTATPVQATRSALAFPDLGCTFTSTQTGRPDPR